MTWALDWGHGVIPFLLTAPDARRRLCLYWRSDLGGDIQIAEGERYDIGVG